MSYNPYSDETVQTRAENYPPMDDLTPKPPPVVAPAPPIIEPTHTPEALTRDENELRARTYKFVIGKFNDYLVWFLTIVETMLGLRFLLKAIGADPNVLFAGFLYAVTNILLLPFLSIVPSPSVNPPNQAFEFSTLIGMLVYFLIFYAFRRFVHLLISPPEDNAST